MSKLLFDNSINKCLIGLVIQMQSPIPIPKNVCHILRAAISCFGGILQQLDAILI